MRNDWVPPKRKNPVISGGAGGGTRTHTESPPADFESATSTIPSHRRTSSEYITEGGKFQEKFIEFSPAVLEKGSQGQWG